MNNQIAAISQEWNCADFWQQWQQHQDYLYHCCLKWMNGNSTDAEDALSRAMLKAWEKVQKFGGKIANFKSWLTKLTHNLCVDIHREYKRSANRIEDIETIGEDKALFLEDTALSDLETQEKKIAIRSAIDNLPTRLRETFILHFYHQLSHQEIVEEQGISYQNVCKRISQARKILGEELRGYFIGDSQTDTELSVTPQVTESVKEEVETVVVEAKHEIGESEQDSEGNLEVKEEKSDRTRCVEVALYKLSLVLNLDLGQFNEEISCWENFCLVHLYNGEKNRAFAKIYSLNFDVIRVSFSILVSSGAECGIKPAFLKKFRNCFLNSS